MTRRSVAYLFINLAPLALCLGLCAIGAAALLHAGGAPVLGYRAVLFGLRACLVALGLAGGALLAGASSLALRLAGAGLVLLAVLGLVARPGPSRLAAVPPAQASQDLRHALADRLLEQGLHLGQGFGGAPAHGLLHDPLQLGARKGDLHGLLPPQRGHLFLQRGQLLVVVVQRLADDVGKVRGAVGEIVPVLERRPLLQRGDLLAQVGQLLAQRIHFLSEG